MLIVNKYLYFFYVKKSNIIEVVGGWGIKKYLDNDYILKDIEKILRD